MAQTSTVPTVKTQLVNQFRTALNGAGEGAVDVTYAWPGPGAHHEAVFLGRHPDLDDIRLDVNHDLPTIKAGRQRRQEDYQLDFTVWTFRPDLSSDQAEECETRAFEILDPLEDLFADDPTVGLGNTVQFLRVVRVSTTLWPFNKGWACELLVTVEVQARLQ